MKSLQELYQDHQGKVSDKWELYLREYDRLLLPYRDQPIRMLEIGIQNGGSLEIWSRYFSKGDKFVGCDIDPNCAKLRYDDSRVTVVIGDANTDQCQAGVLKLSDSFDLIIDDGSHTTGDIVKSFSRYFPFLEKGGLYITEDLHCSYWQDFEGGLYYPYSSMAFFKRLADVINHQHWGIPEQRDHVLKGIAEHFSVDLSDDLLSEIHSIEFVNSMCIVRKLAHDLNHLGSRFIAGQEELVVVELHSLIDQFQSADEGRNAWSILNQAPDEQFEALRGQIACLHQTVSERDGRIANLNEVVAERDAKMARLAQVAVELDGQIKSFNEAIAERDGQIDSLNRAVTERDGRIAGLNQVVEDGKRQVAQILASTSWRITAPTRYLSRALNIMATMTKQSVGRYCQSAYHRLPMPLSTKLALKHNVFRILSPILKNTASYKRAKVASSFQRPEINHQGLWSDVDSKTRTAMGRDEEGDVSAVVIATAAAYESSYQEKEDFSGLETDVKAVAFYLPQFHRLPENDKWWGEGFTEWTNTRKAKPRFDGHYQPREPHTDIGYYDLADVRVLMKQVELAKQHGIYGFCFYHYWFSGKRLLEKPVDLLLQHREIDTKFMLCWANENWTRTWDGQQRDVLAYQEYSSENDIKFISDLKKYLDDPRYIRINGRPVITIYNALALPDPKETFRRWRRWCRDNGVGEILIWAARTFFPENKGMGLDETIDREVEFPPHRVASIPQLSPEFLKPQSGNVYVYDYRRLVQDVLAGGAVADNLSRPMYRTVMMGWDNSARRRDGWSVWYGYSLRLYYMWLRHVVRYTRKNFSESERFVFINAWNEWAEGTYLEPDKKYGYANINVTAKSLFDLPFKAKFQVLSPKCDGRENTIGPGTIAVHAHIFYPDLANEILSCVNNIPYEFDFYVTTDSEEKKRSLLEVIGHSCRARKTRVYVTPNIGRDVAPFLVSCRKIVANYDYVCHIHSKRSTTVDWGHLWRKYLLDNLLGSQEVVRAIIECFHSEPDIGIVFPPAYPIISPFVDWGGNKERCEEILRSIGSAIDLPKNPVFPVGNMFWARSKAVASLFGRNFRYTDFEPENGQLELTLAHAIERVWTYVAEGSGYKPIVALPKEHRAFPPTSAPKSRRIAFFVHHDHSGAFRECDVHYLKKLASVTDQLVLISNGGLDSEQQEVVRPYVDKIVNRHNQGFDFAAWRDGLTRYGFEKLGEYDEIILANNSCYAPIFPFEEMFRTMESEECDFWGVTAFPEHLNSIRAEADFLKDKRIPKHIQSFFMVFRQRVARSEAFRSFWEKVADEENILQVIAKYEVQLTPHLEESGFKWKCYLPESLLLQERGKGDPGFNALYTLPMEFVALRCPFIKKKIPIYASDEQITAVVNSVKELANEMADVVHRSICFLARESATIGNREFRNSARIMSLEVAAEAPRFHRHPNKGGES